MEQNERALRIRIVDNDLVGKVAFNRQDGTLRFLRPEFSENNNDLVSVPELSLNTPKSGIHNR